MPEESKQLRAVIYARRSAPNEDGNSQENSESVDSQVDACMDYANERGWTVLETLIDDGKSAFDEGVTRPRFRELIKLIKDNRKRTGLNIDVVLVRNINRLSRNRNDTHLVGSACHLGGVMIQPLNGPRTDMADPTSRAMFDVISIFSNLDSENKSHDLRVSNAKKRKDGQLRTTQRMYGWQHVPNGGKARKDAAGNRVSNMHANRREARWIQHAFNYMDRTDIEPKLYHLVTFANDPDNRAKFPELAPVKLDKWTVPSVKAVMMNPGVAGFIPLPVPKIVKRRDPETGKEIPSTEEERAERAAARFTYDETTDKRGKWDALVSEDQYKRVRDIILSPSRKRTGAPFKSLLSGIATCYVCGHTLLGATASRKGGRVHIYKCSSRIDENKRVAGDKRVHPSPRQDTIDADVRLEIILAHLAAPHGAREVATEEAVDTAAMYAELDKVLAKRDRLNTAFIELETLSKPEYQRAIKANDAEQERLRAEIAAAMESNAELANAPDLRTTLPLFERRENLPEKLGQVLWTSNTPKHARALAEAYDALSMDQRRALVKRWLTVETAQTEGMTSRWTITHKIATTVHTVAGTDSTRRSLHALNL